MGKKYIIELPENATWIQWIMESTKDHHAYMDFKQVTDLTPYTEPDMEQIKKEAFEKGYNTAVAEQECAVREAAEKGYQKGLSDAWEAAKKICLNGCDGGLTVTEIANIFDVGYYRDALKKYSAHEAIEKIRQYEQYEREKEEIHVGDEVVGTYTGGEETEPFVIIRKIPEIYPTYYFGIYSKSGEFCQGGLKLKKTGRHFPEIAEILAKMKETK